MERHPNIMNAASNLLGICYLIIAGLSLSKSNSRSLADEIAWIAAMCFLCCLALSYVAIRRQDETGWQAVWGDRIFMLGVAMLTLATLAVGYSMR